jgi:hypothetical protein
MRSGWWESQMEINKYDIVARSIYLEAEPRNTERIHTCKSIVQLYILVHAYIQTYT